MPRGDGTGPMGRGPLTGRRMGYCAGFQEPGYVNCGFGMGFGRGFRRMNYMPGYPGWINQGQYYRGYVPYPAGVDAASAPNEKEILQNQADFLEKQLNQVRERLKGLEKTE